MDRDRLGEAKDRRSVERQVPVVKPPNAGHGDILIWVIVTIVVMILAGAYMEWDFRDEMAPHPKGRDRFGGNAKMTHHSICPLHFRAISIAVAEVAAVADTGISAAVSLMGVGGIW